MMSDPNTELLVGGKHFSKSRRARKLLEEQSEEIVAEYRQAMRMAIAAGEYEPGLKAYQHLVDHLPADDEGVRVIDSSVDKIKEVAGPKGPVIQIGVNLGGLAPTQKQLEPVIIDVKPEQ